LVPSDIATAWDRFSADYQREAQLPTDVAHYGPDVPTEAELHLLGDLRGKRVLELGCGAGQCSIAFAKQGATAIGVDFSAEQLAYGRRLSEEEDVKVELRLGDMADLAFLRADSIDLAFSAFSFQYVEDLNRVFRQVHRVLKVGAPLVFSLPHPAYYLIDEDAEDPLVIQRSYFARGRYDFKWGGLDFSAFHHPFAELYMGLARASYRVDLVVEPEPVIGAPRSAAWRDVMTYVPRTLIIRARKEGN
jgi:ubiquinone/menaquinone biosynthesis C-methylase UbiE